MPAGDVVIGLQSVSSGQFLDIRPSSGVEWVIHNIYHEDEVEVYLSDGTNNLLFEVDTNFGVFAWYEFHVTNSIYLRVKNTHSSSKLIGYDGVVTK